MSRAAAAALALLLLSACASQSTHLDLGPVPPGVTVDARIQYYDVTAASLTELRTAMMRLGPRWEGRSYQAVTQSHFRWTFQIHSSGGGSCDIRRAKVQVQTTVIFPRWTPSAEPDSAMLEWWRQLNAGLVEHERGHALLSVRAAGEIVRDIEKLGNWNCGDIGNQANAAAQKLVQASQVKQVEYDATTRHGAAQIQQAGRLREP